MLQLQDEASNKHELSSVDSLLPIESKDIKPLEDELEGSQYEVAEEDDLEVEDPALIQTKHDFVTSPWSRLGIIGGAFGAGFLVIFVVLNGMMNGGGKNAKKPEVTPTPTPTVAASEKKDGDVYAKLALAKQQEELDALNGKGKTEDKEEKKEATEEEQSKNKEKTRSTRQRRVVTQETPPTSRRRVYREEAPETVRPRRREVASQPIPPLRPSAPLPKLAKQIVASNQSVAKDPIAELERLRSLGSVGRVDYMLASTTVSEPTNPTVQEVTAKTEEEVNENVTRNQFFAQEPEELETNNRNKYAPEFSYQEVANSQGVESTAQQWARQVEVPIYQINNKQAREERYKGENKDIAETAIVMLKKYGTLEQDGSRIYRSDTFVIRQEGNTVSIHRRSDELFGWENSLMDFKLNKKEEPKITKKPTEMLPVERQEFLIVA